MKTFLALILMATVLNTQQPAEPTVVSDPVCTTANGEQLPKPGSKLTYEVIDNEKPVAVPAGMAFIPAGEFTFGAGPSAKKVRLDAYCIGKYHVTNAEFKLFLQFSANRSF